MRLGVFGGSFDPVHLGHLLLAEYCREAAGLDRVWFTPAATPPHKKDRPLSDASHRVNMLRLAIGGHEAFEVCTDELERGGTSYTYQTLQQLHRARPNDELFLLIGGDSFEDLPRWREPATVLSLAWPVVVGRVGSQVDWQILAPLVPAERLQAMPRFHVCMPAIELSSTEIRRRVQLGQSIRYQTPRAVEMYIRAAGLYQDAPPAPPEMTDSLA